MELTPSGDPSKLAKASWLLSASVSAIELATLIDPGDIFVIVTLATVLSFAMMLASMVSINCTQSPVLANSQVGVFTEQRIKLATTTVTVLSARQSSRAMCLDCKLWLSQNWLCHDLSHVTASK